MTGTPKIARRVTSRWSALGAATVGATLVLVLGLSGCSLLDRTNTETHESTGPVTDETAGPTAAPVPADESPVYQQAVSWRRCGTFECASVDVPLDWADPA